MVRVIDCPTHCQKGTNWVANLCIFNCIILHFSIAKYSAHKKENETKKIVTRYEYYPGTTYGSHGKYIKFIFNLNSDSYINSAYKREMTTQRLLATYTYLPNTKYGQHGSKITGITLNVPIISQLPELPTGCEITAVTMMLQYLGLDVDKITL